MGSPAALVGFVVAYGPPVHVVDVDETETVPDDGSAAWAGIAAGNRRTAAPRTGVRARRRRSYAEPLIGPTLPTAHPSRARTQGPPRRRPGRIPPAAPSTTCH